MYAKNYESKLKIECFVKSIIVTVVLVGAKTNGYVRKLTSKVSPRVWMNFAWMKIPQKAFLDKASYKLFLSKPSGRNVGKFNAEIIVSFAFRSPFVSKLNATTLFMPSHLHFFVLFLACGNALRFNLRIDATTAMKVQPSNYQVSEASWRTFYWNVGLISSVREFTHASSYTHIGANEDNSLDHFVLIKSLPLALFDVFMCPHQKRHTCHIFYIKLNVNSVDIFKSFSASINWKSFRFLYFVTSERATRLHSGESNVAHCETFQLLLWLVA